MTNTQHQNTKSLKVRTNVKAGVAEGCSAG
jgi:hypothetical protein